MIDSTLRIASDIGAALWPIASLALLAITARAYRVRTPESAALAAITALAAAIGAAFDVAHRLANHDIAVISPLLVAVNIGLAIYWRATAIRRRETIHNDLHHRADQTQGDHQ